MKIARAIALLLCLPLPVAASSSLTPIVEAGASATDNAGDRPDALGRRSDVMATGAAGGRLVISRPLWSIRVEGLGEYERYLSAAVRNTGASGGLDGKWRPDERTFVRSTARMSYSPDRYDPRVPYRLALAVPAGEELPPFVRATTTRWSERVLLDHRLTETQRLRASGAVTGTRYSDRRLADEAGRGGSFEDLLLQGRTVYELGGESLWQAREQLEAGFYAEGRRADYEVTHDAWAASAGAVLEWNVEERTAFRARTGPEWSTVPGTDLPDRLGYNAEAALTHRWTLAELELSAREGMYLADASIPAARRRQGRLTLRTFPFERLSLEAFAGAGQERSLYERYHATGTARLLTAGTSLGWRMTEHLSARVGYRHSRVDTTGRSDLPYRSNVLFVSLSFGGWSLGSPAPEANP